MSKEVTVVIRVSDEDETRYGLGMTTSDLPEGEIVAVGFGNLIDDED